MARRSLLRLQHARRWVLLVGVAILSALHDAAATGTGNGFVLVQIPSTSVYQAALVEAALSSELAARFPSSSAARCVDMRVTNASSYPAASPTMPFDLLFLVGENPISADTASPLPEIEVDSAALQADVTTALSAVVPNGLTLRVVPAAVVAASFGPLPALQPVAAPPPTSAFLRVDMVFRNVLSPLNLTQSLLFQSRRGIQRFLGLAALPQVAAIGPPTVPASSVLLLAQSFHVVLNNNASDATMDNRQRLANLLIYGDPSRLVMENAAQRPAMFLDFAVDLASDPAMDPTVLLTLPYVFSSLSVDVFPPGNAPAPPTELPPGTIVIPATPTDQLLAQVRKRHLFQYAAKNSSDAPPSPMESTAGCPTTAGGGICVLLTWNNTLSDMPFWLESIESVDALAWNLSPSTPFCAAPQTPLPLLPSPLVSSGANAAVWALAPGSKASTRVAFALNLRSLDDNSTRLKVEIAADIRSAAQAATSVTSIARRVGPSGANATAPVYATRSNVVVAYDSLFRANSSEIALFLSLQPSEITVKDTSQPCAHCQNLFEWCASHAACQALSNCVFRDGIEAEQTPAALLQRASLVDGVVDVSPHFRRCISPATELDALLLFASAVRCQLQRMCTVRSPAGYGLVGLDDRVLLWEASDGVIQVSAPPPPLDSTTPAFNLTLRLAGVPLCSLAPSAFASARDMEDFVARHCQFASYLGRVSVAANASAVELRFQDLVGPLPTVEVTPATARAVVTALPALRLRLELADFATVLPPAPVSPPSSSAADLCRTKCRRLALDVCLRDLACVAFTDCIVRSTNAHTNTNTTSQSQSPSPSPSQSMGDALLALFERRVVGESLSLRAAVDGCHTQQTVTNAAWRKLVDAGACLAKHDCPISLQGVVLPPAPDGDAVVAKLRVTPAPTAAVQRLFYQQQDAAESPPTVIPFALQDAQGATLAAASSSLDAFELETTLRSLLQCDDVSARLVANATDDAGLRVVQWEIAYAFWLGRPPLFVESALAPRWRLFSMPSDQPQDYVVEMVAAAANASAAGHTGSGSGSGSDAATVGFVEIATVAS